MQCKVLNPRRASHIINYKMKNLLKSREAIIVFALLVLLSAIYRQDRISEGSFFTLDNFSSIIYDIAMFGLLTIGEAFVILAGGIDLSVGSVIALCSVMVAWFMMVKGVSIAGGIFLTLVLSALVGGVHGFFVTKLKVLPFVITLGTLSVARGAAAIITEGQPITALPESFAYFAYGKLFGLPFPVFILGIVWAASFIIMRKTPLGRYIYAVGGNIQAAKLSGVDVDKVRIFCYMTCSMLAGMSAVLATSKINQGTAQVGGAYELFAIAGAVIGGISLTGGEGGMLGPILGTTLMVILKAGLIQLDVSSFWHDVVIGSVVVLAVTIDSFRRRKELV